MFKTRYKREGNLQSDGGANWGLVESLCTSGSYRNKSVCWKLMKKMYFILFIIVFFIPKHKQQINDLYINICVLSERKSNTIKLNCRLTLLKIECSCGFGWCTYICIVKEVVEYCPHKHVYQPDVIHFKHKRLQFRGNVFQYLTMAFGVWCGKWHWTENMKCTKGRW